MELPFAVVLMRSSYNALDEIDIIPMDEFQKRFFLFRQNEWDDYRQSHPYILQGDLSDSYYFDFISFAQYAILSESCRKPLNNFVEKVIFSSLSFVHCVLKKHTFFTILKSHTFVSKFRLEQMAKLKLFDEVTNICLYSYTYF